MLPHNTRSKVAAAKAKVTVASTKASVKSTRSTAKSAASTPRPSGHIQDDAKATPNVKELLKKQYPHLSDKRLDEMLCKLDDDAEEDGKSDSEEGQQQQIQDTSVVLVAEGTENGEDWGADDETLAPSANKGKNRETVQLRRMAKPHKRKVIETSESEKEGSGNNHDEASMEQPEKKKAKGESARKSAGQSYSPDLTELLHSSEPSPLESLITTRGTGRVKMEPMSPIHVPDDSDDDGSEYKVSSHDREEDVDELDGDVDMDDEIVVKVKDKPQQKKKEKAQSKGKRKVGRPKKVIDVDNNVLETMTQEPLKSFLHHAQQEFRVYLSLENAWPRVMKDGRMEKTEKPVEIMKMLMEKHERYKTERFLTAYNRAWADAVTHGRMIHYVAKVSSQLRQEVKQKAKRVVEKNFLAFKVPQHGSDGKKLSSAAYNEKTASHLEALVKFLKQDFAFHHGNLEMPDPMVDPSLWVANLDAPFHNEAVAEVAARQWWSGAHREAMRPENHARFDINKQPLSSNMIALVCSAIIVALDEAVKVNITVSFDEKTYATEHDRLKVSIDNLRRCADLSDLSKYDEGCARFCKSMDETLASTIRRLAGISSTSVDDDDEAAEPSTVTRGIPTAAISRISKLWAPKNTGTKASDEPAVAASASGSGQAKEREGDAEV
ncbi:uncharacterized protein B0H18DRAFT_954453 [Fomitopsis serialis]|uniref:uncharacterized protein n=1 Tax=Fomitopsis serialis TaxID=139415 RepID=UPI0020085893|nr:uncharacterized protein B0H18DRAFT_954453 [Neoantrodia serialis]KAH9927321.1 hypothetical protein B0H18DRAFT_954453 [Neoantrodia serialis]